MLASCEFKARKSMLNESLALRVLCTNMCSIILWLKCGSTCEIIHHKSFNMYNNQMSVAQSYIWRANV